MSGREGVREAWCIRTRNGCLLTFTARDLRRDAIAEMTKDGSPPWSYWRKQGCRAVKVTITEKDSER